MGMHVYGAIRNLNARDETEVYFYFQFNSQLVLFYIYSRKADHMFIRGSDNNIPGEEYWATKSLFF